MLVMDEENIEMSAWTGSKHFKGLSAPSVPAGLQLRQGSTASFSPFKSTSRSDTESEELGPGDTLDYYVVLLTWRAQPKSEHDDVPAAATAADAMPTSSTTTNTGVAPPTMAAPRATFNRLNAIPTYYG